MNNNNNNKFLMVTSGINPSKKFDAQKSAVNFFDGTPCSSRVRMGHEHLVQTHTYLHSAM